MDLGEKKANVLCQRPASQTAFQRRHVHYLLIPLRVALVFLIDGIFLWALRQAQFDDLEGPAHRDAARRRRGAPLPPATQNKKRIRTAE
jgi:cbb3-type cytochrome oxidase maturation protein